MTLHCGQVPNVESFSTASTRGLSSQLEEATLGTWECSMIHTTLKWATKTSCVTTGSILPSLPGNWAANFLRMGVYTSLLAVLVAHSCMAKCRGFFSFLGGCEGGIIVNSSVVQPISPTRASIGLTNGKTLTGFFDSSHYPAHVLHQAINGVVSTLCLDAARTTMTGMPPGMACTQRRVICEQEHRHQPKLFLCH